ncbi:MAG TPA: CHAP domain-containing protein [Sphingomonas sp.]
MQKRSTVLMCSIALLLTALPASANAASTGYWSCVPFARMFSGIQLFGNAATWWNQAVGKYARGGAPKAGAVMVFKAIGSMRSGHVATVSEVVSDRIVKVTHANWSGRGQIEHDVEVMDTSARNDWSQVRVWFRNLHDLGTHTYPVYGFIYGGKAPARVGDDDSADAAPAAIDRKAIKMESKADGEIKSARGKAPLAALVG